MLLNTLFYGIAIAKILFAVVSAFYAFAPYFEEQTHISEASSRRRRKTTKRWLATALVALVVGEVGGLFVGSLKEAEAADQAERARHRELALAEANVKRTLTPYRDFPIYWYVRVPIKEPALDRQHLEGTLRSLRSSVSPPGELLGPSQWPGPPPTVGPSPPQMAPVEPHLKLHPYNSDVIRSERVPKFERRDGKLYMTDDSDFVSFAPQPFGTCLDFCFSSLQLTRDNGGAQINFGLEAESSKGWREPNVPRVDRNHIYFFPAADSRFVSGYRDAGFLSLYDVIDASVWLYGPVIAESDAELVFVFDVPQLGVFEAICAVSETAEGIAIYRGKVQSVAAAPSIDQYWEKLFHTSGQEPPIVRETPEPKS
jgi:hypothetical protein